MPIYEYRCAGCGFQKEYLQKMTDAPLTDCPECGKPRLAKMVTAAGFHLKGSGWYATDFKTAPKAETKAEPAGSAAAKAEDKPAVKTDDKATATSDSKPAAEPASTKSEPAKTGSASDAPRSNP
jgi:putative FmdB family regulatory protein